MVVIAYYNASVVEEMQKRLITIDGSMLASDIWEIALSFENNFPGGSVLVKVEIVTGSQTDGG